MLTMNVKMPGEFYFNEHSDYAVLLLHGFTGNTSDVRQLGRFLQKKGITSYSFNYQGHGEAPENILKSSPHVWYRQVTEAYDFLKSEGYDKIFTAGVSIGGALGLLLTHDRDVTGAAAICSPMFIKSHKELLESYKTYAANFKKRFENKDRQKIDDEINASLDDADDTLEDINTVISKTEQTLEDIFVPVYVAQGSLDEVIDPESANVIYNNVSTEDSEKRLKFYENSGHVLTIDKDKNELFNDLYEFMEEII